MKQWLCRAAAMFTLASLPMAGVATLSPAVSHAEDLCGIGWYFNHAYNACQPYAPAAYPAGPNVNVCVSATGRRGRVTGSVCT